VVNPRRPLHILHVVAGLYAGGAELLVAEIARAAGLADLRVSVCALGEKADGAAARRLRESGVEPWSLGLRRLSDPRELRRLRAHIRAVGPDVVHTHLLYPDVLGGLSARSLGIPAVSTIHSDGIAGDRRQRAKERLGGFVRRHCDARVIAVSERARQSYLATGWDTPGRVVTIHNAVDAHPRPGAGAAVRAELGIDPTAPVAAMLSVLRPEKRHLMAFEATRRIVERDPRFRLLVVGDGVERERLAAASADLGEAVIMYGHSDDPMSLLDAADLLLHCSSTEAFPTALVEAMAASLPIVAFAVGGIPELVADGENGVLLDPDRGADAVAVAVSALAEDPALRRRLGDAGRRRYEADLTADRWLERLRAVYEEVLAG
jgi:glycosyltransferase involved in cell wall biosynthesis